MKRPNLFIRVLCCYFSLYMALPVSVWAQLTISVPSFPTTNTVRVTLTGAQSTNAHIIFFSPNVAASLGGWTRATTGTVGQTTFDLTKPTNASAFFAAGIAPISTPTVATPVFSPGGGSYPTATNVVITCDTPGASIYYTTNGNTPTTLDTYIYTGGSVYLNCSVTLKAKAFAAGFNDSAVATATYSINCPPTVDAGPQQIITSSSTTLQGVVIDDGLTGGGTRFTNWDKISGPGTVTFGNSHQTNSSATFGANGIYVLQLSASDGQYTNSAQVAIAVNPTLSVSLTAPAGGSGYTVPTNILLQATASCTSGSVTQVLFYANTALIGTADTEPFSVQWKSVAAGTQVLTAVAVSTDPDNYSLASTSVTINVNWPTNVGQVTFALNDLQIPAAGLPISINRLYDTRYGTNGSFGYNGRLDYETIKIEKSASLADGWVGTHSGITWCIAESSRHLVTVSLSDSEKYYFVPQLVFDLGGNSCINASQTPDCYNFYNVHLVCLPIGQGALSVASPGADVGMDDQLSGWVRPLTAVYYDGFGFPISNYDPDFSAFTFTAPDGTRYGFNSDGTVASKTDRNGNAVNYSASGITHSSGKQVTFTRDGNNRITEIYDPIALAASGSAALTYAYDGLGNLTNAARLIQRSPAVYENTAYAYTNASFPYNVTAITDPRGVVSSRYEYDSSGRLARQYDALGRYSSYTYDLANHRQIITDKLNNSTIQNFTPAGEVASVKDAAGGVTAYGYDEQGRKISETNALGKATSYAYDENNNIIGVTNEIGSASSATYNKFGQPLVTIDARGYGTTNEYDANGNLLFATNALSVVTAYGYDSQGNRVAETNALGLPEQVVVLNVYDEFGNLTNTATLNSTSYTYDGNGNKLTEMKTRTLPGGGTQTLLTQWSYDAANRILQTIEPDGFTNKVYYNGLGKQAQTIDKLSRTNTFYYDPIGLLTNTTYADGLSEKFFYDAEGRKTNSVDRGGRATSYDYNALGRLTLTTYPDGSYTATGYDAAGRIRSTSQGPVPPGGFIPPPNPIATVKYSYDAAGRRVAATNALGQGSRFTYDANGNQTSVIDALNRTNTYLFDALNRQVQIIFPDGATESYGYDGLDRKVATTNQAGVATRFGFDALGRLIAVTNAFGASQQMVTKYVYDEAGNLLQQVDALNRTNKFECDALGRRTKEIQPANQSALFSYDAVGSLIRQTNFNNVIITNQYDALNRLTNKSSAGGYKITFAYSPTGQRTNMVDASGTNTYTYDTRDRLLTKATPQGTLTYTYDSFGNLATIQSSTANGVSLSYGYDLLNRLSGVTNVAQASSLSLYGFDAVGNLQTVQLPNNVTNTYTYDSLNRLTNLVSKSTNGTIASFAYKLAAFGNRTNLIETVNGVSRTNVWVYDPLYRLTNETITATGGGAVSYKYDAVGNRTNRNSTVTGVSSITNSFNSNDQLTTDVYDNNGNTRTNGSDTFLYDVENRLTNAVVGGTNIVIVYDGDGNRVKKIVGTTTNIYLVDDRNPSGYAQVLEEKIVGSTTNLYAYGLDLISQSAINSQLSIKYYGYDGNGNTRFLTGTNAAITDTYAYDAFGILLTNTGTTVNFYRYCGEQYDPNLGFVYLRARYMNPNSGRFMTRDSVQGKIFDPPSLHRYTYCANDPVNKTDPSGHEGLGTTLTVIGITVLVAAAVFVTYKIFTSNTFRAGRLQAKGTLATADQFNTIIAGLGQINVHPRIQELKGFLEDSANSDLTIYVLPGNYNQGSHNAALKHKLFIPVRAFQANDGGVSAAIFSFGEFQHDALGGGLSETEAQREIDEVIAAIRRAKPLLNVPDYRHGGD